MNVVFLLGVISIIAVIWRSIFITRSYIKAAFPGNGGILFCYTVMACFVSILAVYLVKHEYEVSKL